MKRYCCSFAKEQRIMSQAYKMGYRGREEVAKILVQEFIPGAVLDVSGGSERLLLALLRENADS